MRVISILAALVGLLMMAVPLRALAAPRGEAGPHGGVVVGNEAHRLELAFDTHKRNVDVYVIKNRSNLPDAIGLTLVDAKGNTRVFELRVLASATGAALQYHGSLGPAEQSFVGFELRIPMRAEPPLVIKSE